MALDSSLVQARLQEAANRFRWSRGIRWLISGAAGSMFFLIVFLLCDARFHLGPAGRWAAFLLTLLPSVAGIVLAMPSWFQKMSHAGIARRIERSCSGAGNVLISAVQFDRDLAAESPLRSALFREMHDPFPGVRWAEVFDLDLLKKLALALAGVTLVLAAWAFAQPAYFSNSAARIFLPSGHIAPLTRTRILDLKPGDTEVARGREVTLTVKLGGQIPRSAWVWFRDSGATWQKALMETTTGTPEFSHTWKEVREPLEYFIEAGDIRSATCRIRVRPRTVICSRSAEIEPPAYTHLPASSVPNFSTLQNLVPGSRATIALKFNNPVGHVRVAGESQTGFTVTRKDDTSWQLDGKIVSSKSINIEYTDANGVADTDALQVTVKPDAAPAIRITAPPEGREIVMTRDASLALQCEVTDDFGLGSVAVFKSTSDKTDAQAVQEWKDAAGKKSFVAETQIPIRQFLASEDESVTFCVIAKDQNDVSGPGITVSRPIVVRVLSPEKLQKQSTEERARLRLGIEELIKLQKTNLDETRAGITQKPAVAAGDARLLDRQSRIADMAKEIRESPDTLSPELRADLRSLGEKELQNAVLALRSAVNAGTEIRAKSLALAADIEAAILARLVGVPAAVDSDSRKEQMQDLIAGVEDLLREQRGIYRETNVAADQSARMLSERQDALAEKSVRVRKQVGENAQNAAMGDSAFRARLSQVAAMLGDLRVYEGMLAAAEKLQGEKFPEAATVEKAVIVNLVKIVEVLNQWQMADAATHADALKKDAAEIKDKLGRLADIQREIVEKSKEMAHKDDFRAEDQSTAKEIQKSKDLMAEAVEQMLTDAHVFPELKPSNELRSELTQIYEDVIQEDKQDAAEGTLKPSEIAVQKEDGLLKAIEEAQKIAADMEMWLPNKNETQKWLLENFDKTEIPEIPNLPLPDAFEDIVGKLLDEQKGLAEQVQDAASNQAFAQNPANGWEIADGPMPGFGAQGKSGNQRPNKNEQTGRSSGGREGMSDGEMVGDRASNLEGTTPDIRRTSDPMQQGQVKDDGGINSTRATGGGKAGGFSDRNGMDGNAPLRAAKAPSLPASDALAVKQALLAEKTSKKYAQASLLYLHANGLADVPRLMEESQAALKDGRLEDFNRLHKQIVGQLHATQGGLQSGSSLVLPTKESPGGADKQLLGGDEGEAPEAYRKQVADYYRSLTGSQ
jgi:hypothetical protein